MLIFDCQYFLLKSISMGSAMTCGKLPGDFKIPKFEEKNRYLTKSLHSQPDLEKIILEIAPAENGPNIHNIAKFILESPDLIFRDSNFMQAGKEASTNKLSKLYDYKKRNIDRFYSSNKTMPDCFSQMDVELAYCSSVMYLLCSQPQLKERIILTRVVNKHHAYVMRLFCNGASTVVVVDDEIVVGQKGSISYLNITKGKELWPMLLEKAWVKQIGGFEKSKGLSPEDCFEEITGIPAYSFIIKDNSYTRLKQILRNCFINRYWVALTGHIANKTIRSRQIFVVEDVQDDGNTLLLRSPYEAHELEHTVQGAVKMQLPQLMEIFEFATIGYYMPDYEATSLAVSSKKNEEVIIEVTLRKEQIISLRFVQFYKEYLDESEKDYYEYSPLCMELYNESKELMDECEGIPEIMEGVRSSHLTKGIFLNLQPGKYYLRLQVAWVNEKELNSGNLVAYASSGSVKMARSPQNNKLLSEQLVLESLNSHYANKIDKPEQELVVRWLEKQYRYILSVENMSKEASSLKIVFKGSENIKVNHYEMKDMAIRVEVKSEEMVVLEIIPADPHKAFQLAPFDIFKL